MKILVSTTYGENYDELAALCVPNHLAYCRKNGYEYNVHHAPHGCESVHFNSFLNLVNGMRVEYDYIMTIDLDLLFMDMNWKTESLIEKNKEAKIIVPDEYLGEGGSTINCGVVLWNTNGTHLLMKILMGWEKYKDIPGNWQSHILELKMVWGKEIKVVSAHEMNAQAKPGYECSWREGDPIVHFYCMPLEEKIRYAKEYLQKVRQ
jgi:hypothetical protein